MIVKLKFQTLFLSNKATFKMWRYILCSSIVAMMALAVQAGPINLYGHNPGPTPMVIGDPVRLSPSPFFSSLL
jgi:hypothetical protein